MVNVTIENKTITILKEQIDKLANIESLENWSNWKSSTLVFIARIYGEKASQYLQFKQVSAFPSAYTKSTLPNIPKATNRSKILLESFIIDLETFGLSQNDKIDTNSKANIKIENHNNLSQTQNVELNIVLETIQDEIPPKTLREIEELNKSEEPKESKLQKIGEILKNTGIEVVSSTLAKIIGQTMGIF